MPGERYTIGMVDESLDLITNRRFVLHGPMSVLVQPVGNGQIQQMIVRLYPLDTDQAQAIVEPMMIEDIEVYNETGNPPQHRMLQMYLDAQQQLKAQKAGIVLPGNKAQVINFPPKK
jgi:hypothetical protein